MAIIIVEHGRSLKIEFKKNRTWNEWFQNAPKKHELVDFCSLSTFVFV